MFNPENTNSLTYKKCTYVIYLVETLLTTYEQSFYSPQFAQRVDYICMFVIQLPFLFISQRSFAPEVCSTQRMTDWNNYEAIPVPSKSCRKTLSFLLKNFNAVFFLKAAFVHIFLRHSFNSNRSNFLKWGTSIWQYNRSWMFWHNLWVKWQCYVGCLYKIQ